MTRILFPIELFSTMKYFNHYLFLFLHNTPQPLYNTIVGVQSINHVSYTTVLYPNKNV